jgi:Tfp pilus assembly PilM family ATPase
LARFLALDWDHGQLHVVSANVGRGGVQIQRAAVWQQEQDPASGDAEALGLVLRERLREAGIAPAPVLVSVGRDRVILKDVRYPQVPASEEPAVVRFQASKELTEPADEVVIDYAPTGEPGPNGERRALALILRRRLLTAYQNVCKAAGLKLLAVTPRPFGIAACALRSAGALVLSPAPEAAGVAVAVLTVAGGWAEFSVVRGDHLLFARSLAAGTGLVGEIRRNLALYAGQPQVTSARDRVQALYVAGDGENAGLREGLQELLAIPVHPLDPFAGAAGLDLAGPRAGFAGAVGLLYAQAQGLPIDFAHPKEPRPETDPNKRRKLVAALGAVALLAGVFIIGQIVLAYRQKNIAELQDQLQALDGQVSLLQKDSDNLKTLKGWTDTAVPWIEELAEVSERFPDTKVMHLTELSGRPTTVKASDQKHVAEMALNGEYTGDEQEVIRLNGRLLQTSLTSYYHLADQKITQPPDNRTPGKFTEKILIEKRDPDKEKPAVAGKPAAQVTIRRLP